MERGTMLKGDPIEDAVAAERRACGMVAVGLAENTGELLLRMGEMTKDEILSVRAALRLVARMIMEPDLRIKTPAPPQQQE